METNEKYSNGGGVKGWEIGKILKGVKLKKIYCCKLMPMRRGLAHPVFGRFSTCDIDNKYYSPYITCAEPPKSWMCQTTSHWP